MQFHPFLLSFVVCVVGVSGIRGDEVALRPNVLFIMADDLNNELGCYGSRIVSSPNLDRLAARGVRFDRAYCQYPVCNPSRASLLSGRRPETTKVLNNQTPTRATLGDAIMLPECFRQQGYRTIKVGKIYHTNETSEDPRSWDVDIREKKAKSAPPEQIVRKEGPIVEVRADDADTWDGFVARKSVELMTEAAAGKQPWFVAAGFRRPHTPYIAPQKYFALHDVTKLAPRPGPPEHLAKIPVLALPYKLDPRVTFPSDVGPETMHAYYASISFLDAQVGLLLDALDKQNLWDRTIVVFASDHGYHLGEHGGLWHKRTHFEECHRVPLLVAAPGKKTNVASPRLVELVDLYPTLGELCGLKVPDDLEGTSFVPLLSEPQRAWKKAAFGIVLRGDDADEKEKMKPGSGRTVRTERLRYSEWSDGGRELYDETADPNEYANLADDPARADDLRAMQSVLNAGWKAARPE
jgi:uncharacterized sulfatase